MKTVGKKPHSQFVSENMKFFKLVNEKELDIFVQARGNWKFLCARDHVGGFCKRQSGTYLHSSGGCSDSYFCRTWYMVSPLWSQKTS